MKTPWILCLGLLLQGANAAADPIIEISAGAATDDNVLRRIYLGVEFRGIAGSGRTDHWTFLAADGSVMIAPTEGQKLPEVDFDLHPVSYDFGAGKTLLILPSTITREVDLGVNGGAVVHVMGVELESEADLTRAKSDPKEMAKLTAYAKLTVDALGLAILKLTSGPYFTGTSTAKVEVEAGLSWNISRLFHLKLSAGASEDVLVGSVSGESSPSTSPFFMTEAYGRLSLLLTTLKGEYSLFAEALYERFDLLGAGSQNLGDGELKFIFGVSGAY
ncbi:MAG: hypothetical protein ACXWP5_03475 [Bdellovibrionota bacterium]